MKIINENEHTTQRNLNGKINLLNWRHRSRRVARESVIFAWFSIFLCSDTLSGHILIRSFLFIWKYCSSLHVFLFFSFCAVWFLNVRYSIEIFTHSRKKKIFPNFSFLFSFDRLIVPSKENTLCVPLQSFIIFFISLFAVFFGHIMLFDSWVDLISCVKFYFLVSGFRASHTLLKFWIVWVRKAIL